MKSKTIWKLGIFAFLVTFGIVISIIYYELLRILLPEESTFIVFPFNTALFVFAMTYAVIIPIVIFFSGKKMKQKIRELNKKKSL